MKPNHCMAMVFCCSAALLAACGSGYVTDSRSASYVVDSGVGMGKRWQGARQSAVPLKIARLAEDGIHDPANEAINVLQEPRDAMAAFPLDRSGAVDWSKALALGIIAPHADVGGNAQMAVMDMDVTFKDTQDMAWITFTHAAHTQWLGCDACHTGIFIPKKGANEISMDRLFAGEQCGLCHGSVAFGLMDCERCHNTPRDFSRGIAGEPPPRAENSPTGNINKKGRL